MTKNYFILTFTTILSCFICQPTFASSVLGSGTCGENAEAGTKCEWKVVDLGDGKKELQIYGSGPMDNYNASWDKPITSSNVPWRNYQSSITSVSIGEGITSIGDTAFIYALNLKNVDLSKATSLYHIGKSALSLSGIENITIPASVKTIDKGFLGDDSYLQSVTFQGDIPDIGDKMFWGGTPDSVNIYYDQDSNRAQEKLEQIINYTKQWKSGLNPSLIACIPHNDGSKDLFDAQGKLLKRIDESGNLVQTYVYNEKGQLISILDPDGNKIESYKYDFGGNLIAVYKNGERVFAKRIYTVPEAIAATHQNKNTFSIIYR